MAEDKLHKYLEPILGLHSTVEVIRRLEEMNPELKGNEELRDKFIKEIEKVPDSDKNSMVVTALKLSKIKDVLAEEGDNFEHAGAYRDFENITTRLLKNFYNMAKYADSMFSDESLTEEEVVAAFDGPISSARSVVFNDTLEKSTSLEQAQKEVDTTIRAAAGGMKDFKLLVEYIAEKSGNAAEIMFNTKEFRNFSQWGKERAIEKAKQQALTGKQETPDLTDIRTGTREYG